MSSLSWNEIEPYDESQSLFFSHEQQQNKNNEIIFRTIAQNQTSNHSSNQNNSNHSFQNISSKYFFGSDFNKSNKTSTNHSINISNSLENEKNESGLLASKGHTNSNFSNKTNNSETINKTKNISEFTSKNESIQNQTSNNSNENATTNFSQPLLIKNISENVQGKNESHNENNESNITRNNESQNEKNNTTNISILDKNNNLSNTTSNYSNNNSDKNVEKLKNEFENITNVLNTQNDLSNSSKDLLDTLNYTNLSVKNTLKTKKSHYHLRKSKKFSSLRSFIKSSLIVDNLNEMNFIKRSLNEKSNLKLLLEMLEDYNNCSLYSSCDSCAQDMGCGWCPTLSLCIIGDREGPYLGKCPLYQYGFCKGHSCMRYTDCFSCISDDNCGWCNNEEKNYIGCTELHGDEYASTRPDSDMIYTLNTNSRLNKCFNGDYGKSKNQLDLNPQERFWETIDFSRMRKIKKQSKEIQEKLGTIPSKEQIKNFFNDYSKKEKRVQLIENALRNFSPKYHIKKTKI